MAIKGGMHAFSRGEIDRAPDSEGVYALYDHDVLIYIGRSTGSSDTVRTRLHSHKNGYEGRRTRRATLYRLELCDDPASRERELLNEYRAANGELPPGNALTH